MLLSSAEIARGTEGTLRLLQRDPSGPLHFDNTVDACLRSFRVMLPVAPLYALYVAASYAQVDVAADGWEIFFVEALRYVVDWLLFPVLFYEIARRRQWLDRYPRYIASLNWISLPAMALLLVDAAIGMVAPTLVSTVVDLAVQALLFYWIVVTTRMTLGVGWVISGVLLVVNWMPSILLSLIVNRFLGVTPLAGS